MLFTSCDLSELPFFANRTLSLWQPLSLSLSLGVCVCASFALKYVYVRESTNFKKKMSKPTRFLSSINHII